jgi:molybdopterin molybdotransferase
MNARHLAQDSGCCASHATHAPLLDVAEAQARIRARVASPSRERLPLAHVEGRVLAVAVDSAIDLPPFDNAAMDGYALAWRDNVAARRELDVHAEQAAGEGRSRLIDGCAIAIMTGARMPDRADLVVPVEEATVLARDDDGRPRRIRVERAPHPGQHVRRAGEDIACGTRAVDAGTRLDAAACMLLRGVGIAEVDVACIPRVALFSTGRELVDTPGRALASGQIHDTNRPWLESRLIAAGAGIAAAATLPDDAGVFVDAVRRSLDEGVDLVISTGAVSKGRYDFVPHALATLGADIVFHGLAMRPGKPLLFALLPGGVPFFGLPGNPVSSAVGARFFVECALRAMLGMRPERAWRLPLAAPVVKKRGVHLYQKAELRLDDEGRVAVSLLQGQESFRTRPLLRTRAWAGLPADADTLPAGHLVDVHPLLHFDDDLFARP